LAGWGRLPGGISSLKKHRSAMKLLRPLLPLYRRFFAERRSIRNSVADDGYLLFSDPGGVSGKIGPGLFPGDGHCTFSPDGRLMLTDTYPNREHQRQLLLYDMVDEELSELALLASLPSHSHGLPDDWDTGGCRCDLHPRWNRAGDAICFDSVHEGDRRIYQAILG